MNIEIFHTLRLSPEFSKLIDTYMKVRLANQNEISSKLDSLNTKIQNMAEKLSKQFQDFADEMEQATNDAASAITAIGKHLTDADEKIKALELDEEDEQKVLNIINARNTAQNLKNVSDSLKAMGGDTSNPVPIPVPEPSLGGGTGSGTTTDQGNTGSTTGTVQEPAPPSGLINEGPGNGQQPSNNTGSEAV